jgi:hypothetical protein
MEQLPPELVGRAIQDVEFRRRLLADPASVVASEGFDLTEEQIQGLENLDAEAVDEAIEAMLGDLATSKWG